MVGDVSDQWWLRTDTFYDSVPDWWTASLCIHHDYHDKNIIILKNIVSITSLGSCCWRRWVTRGEYVDLIRHVLAHSLQWRDNGRDGVSNHQPYDCLLNRLFGRRPKKTPKLRVTGLCAENSPVTGEFITQMASNAENVSIWWRHHDPLIRCHQFPTPLSGPLILDYRAPFY